jgi:thymidylate synthase
MHQMKVFEFDSVAESYTEIVKYVLQNGDEVSPRGQLTREITPATIVINNPRKRVADHPDRRLNYGFMIGELIWILQGKNDLSITHYNKQWANFSDDGNILNGAYGQRIFNWDGGEAFVESEDKEISGETMPSVEIKEIRVNQFMQVYNRLLNDSDSRQGTISLFDPAKDFAPTKDVPCTNWMRFTIRNGKLNMLVGMRSNDLWWGYPYDVYNFTMLQEIMAGLLGVEVGKYTHIADSLHLYEMHFEAAQKMINNEHTSVYNSFEPIDARLQLGELDKTADKVFTVEHITRENGADVKVEEVINLINEIQNEYWKSLAASIATYNFKKSKRDLHETDELRKYITNEFNGLL